MRKTNPFFKLTKSGMYGNYQKIAFRNIAKYKVYNGINMFGLAVASAFLILVYSFIQHERSFDQFHDKASVLYRVELTGLGRVSSTETKDFFSALTRVDDSRYTQLPPGLAPALQSALPEIKQTFRFLYGREFIIGVNDKKFFQSDICLVDSNFFSLFSFLLAVPFAWYFMNKWLGDFAYRIEISWDIFILTWLIGLFLALFSVGYNSLKSALSNPVKSIQN